MRDIRFNRMKDEEAEERNDADVQAEKVDVEMQTDEAEVRFGTLEREDEHHKRPRPLFNRQNYGRPPDSQEGKGSDNHDTKRDENDTTADEREQDYKRRRLQVLSSEECDPSDVAADCWCEVRETQSQCDAETFGV